MLLTAVSFPTEEVSTAANKKIHKIFVLQGYYAALNRGLCPYFRITCWSIFTGQIIQELLFDYWSEPTVQRCITVQQNKDFIHIMAEA
jgi:hypothetical protein